MTVMRTLIQKQWFQLWFEAQKETNSEAMAIFDGDMQFKKEIQETLKQCEDKLNESWRLSIARYHDASAVIEIEQDTFDIKANDSSKCIAVVKEEMQNFSYLSNNSKAALSECIVQKISSSNEDYEHTHVGHEQNLEAISIVEFPVVDTVVVNTVTDEVSIDSTTVSGGGIVVVAIGTTNNGEVENILVSDREIQSTNINTDADEGLLVDEYHVAKEKYISPNVEPTFINNDAELGDEINISSEAKLHFVEGVCSMPKNCPPISRVNNASEHFYRVTLPNAREGEKYTAQIVLDPLVNSVVSKVEFEPECGLYWDAEEKRCISGTPNINGNVSVKVWWHLAQSENTQHELVQTTLYINADPKLLWRNIESDSEIAFWKSDDAIASIAGEYDMIAARVRGRSHAHVGSCCDDDFAIEKIDAEKTNGLFTAYIAVVSDGAGSAPYSRYGSKLAVEAAQKKLSELLQSDASLQFVQNQMKSDSKEEGWQEYVQSLLSNAAYHAYLEQVNAVQHDDVITDIRQLSSTLIIGMSLKLPNQKWLIGAYWVGDGAIALYQPGNDFVELLGESDSGEFSGQTRFLSKEEVGSECLNSRIVYKVVEEDYALILMTDGVSDPKFDSEQALNQVSPWNQLWQEWEELGQQANNEQEMAKRLQQWLEFWSPGNHDDRTLVIVSPHLYSHKQTDEKTVNS